MNPPPASRQWPGDDLLKRWLILGLAVFLAGYFVLEDRSGGHRPIYYLAVLLPWLLLLSWRRELWRDLWPSPLFRLVLLMLAAALASLLYQADLHHTDAYDVLRHAVLVLSLIHVGHFLRSRDPLAHLPLLRTLALAGGASAAWYGGGFIALHGGDFSDYRLHLTLAHASNPNQVATLYASVALVSCGLWIRERRGWLRLALAGSYLAALTVVFMTHGRASILAVAAGTALLLAHHRHWKLLAVLGSLYLGVFVALETGWIVGHSFTGRTASIAIRMEIWSAALERIAAAPMLGEGWGAPHRVMTPAGEDYPHPHNLVLTALMHGGVVGLAVVAALLGRGLYSGSRPGSEQASGGICTVLLLAYVIEGMWGTRWLLDGIDLTWPILWLPLALLISAEAVQRSTQPAGGRA